MWKCTLNPRIVLMNLGVFECEHCHNRVIALSKDDVSHPNISDYKFCPYCGKGQYSTKEVKTNLC